ncbi:putative periplasmic binding protein-like I [Helianthus annuus]|nr:putative periplasmic binding protein-like I [Helianthus annuus]
MRGLVMLTFVLVFSVHVFSFSKRDTVNIGAIMTMNTVNGKVSTIAMKAAVDDVNSNPNVLPGKRLSLSIHDANHSGFLGIAGGNVFLVHVILFYP